MRGSPRSSSSSGRIRQELVQDDRRRDRERPRGGQGDELRLVLHRLDEPGVRDDEAEALGEPLPVLGDEDHRLVGAVHQHRRGRLPPGELDEAVRQGLVVPLRGLHPVPRHDVVGVAGPAGGVAGRGDHPDRYVRHRQRPHDLDDARTQHDGHRPTLGHPHRTHPSRAVEASSAQVLSTRLLPLRIGEASTKWHQKRQAGHSCNSVSVFGCGPASTRESTRPIHSVPKPDWMLPGRWGRSGARGSPCRVRRSGAKRPLAPRRSELLADRLGHDEHPCARGVERSTGRVDPGIPHERTGDRTRSPGRSPARSGCPAPRCRWSPCPARTPCSPRRPSRCS